MGALRNQIHTLMLALCCLIALASIQCERGKDRAYSRDSTVTMLYPGDEWNYTSEYPLFLPLVAWNEVGELEGRLAERWEHSPDYRTWTIHLRTDVRWHDGVPVTAHDIKFTLDLLRHPEVLRIPPDAISITVLNDHTYSIVYQKRALGSPLDYATVYYPKHLLEELDPKKFGSWEFWKHPVGNGPYRYVRHVPKTMIELEANPDYYMGKPKIERVLLKFGTSSLTELLSGNVDAMSFVNRIDLLKLAGDPRFQVYFYTYYGQFTAIYWNQRHPSFRDPKVRRALTLAINRRELLQVRNFPENTPIFDGIFTWRQLRRREFPEPLPYDPERAKQLLEAAGWQDQDGDGIRERAGEEARFTAMALAEEMVQPAIYVQAQLRRVGIRMEVRPLASGALRARLRAGEFDAVFDRFVSVPRQILYDKWFSPGSPIGYTNPQIVRLLQDAVITFDSEAKDQIYRELMTIFREELPMTFLHPVVRTHVAHRRLRGLKSFQRANPAASMEHLWLEDVD